MHDRRTTLVCFIVNEHTTKCSNYKNLWIPIAISLEFVTKGSINNNPALFQIMAWRRPGDKPLSEPMMVNLLTHICVTRPQWVKSINNTYCIKYRESIMAAQSVDLSVENCDTCSATMASHVGNHLPSEKWTDVIFFYHLQSIKYIGKWNVPILVVFMCERPYTFSETSCSHQDLYKSL